MKIMNKRKFILSSFSRFNFWTLVIRWISPETHISNDRRIMLGTIVQPTYLRTKNAKHASSVLAPVGRRDAT